MHASIRRYIVSSGREPEAIQRARAEFGPMLRTVPGFVAYYFIDTGDGEMIGVSVFDSQQGAERANDLAREYVSAHLSDALQRTTLLEGDVVAYFAGGEPKEG